MWEFAVFTFSPKCKVGFGPSHVFDCYQIYVNVSYAYRISTTFIPCLFYFPTYILYLYTHTFAFICIYLCYSPVNVNRPLFTISYNLHNYLLFNTST